MLTSDVFWAIKSDTGHVWNFYSWLKNKNGFAKHTMRHQVCRQGFGWVHKTEFSEAESMMWIFSTEHVMTTKFLQLRLLFTLFCSRPNPMMTKTDLIWFLILNMHFIWGFFHFIFFFAIVLSGLIGELHRIIDGVEFSKLTASPN